MTYQDAYSEYLEKISEAAATTKIPGFLSKLWRGGKGLYTRGIQPDTGKKALDFAKRYPLQLGATGLGAIGANRAVGNIVYGKRQPGQMSRGALGFGGLF